MVCFKDFYTDHDSTFSKFSVSFRQFPEHFILALSRVQTHDLHGLGIIN